MKDKRELSGDQKPVASDSPVAILVLLPPSISATHSSLRSLAGTVMYITFLPSGEIAGCVAFSAATSELLGASVVSGQKPGRLAVDEVESFSTGIGHGPGVRTGSDRDLFQFLVRQPVLPDVGEAI